MLTFLLAVVFVGLGAYWTVQGDALLGVGDLLCAATVDMGQLWPDATLTRAMLGVTFAVALLCVVRLSRMTWRFPW